MELVGETLFPRGWDVKFGKASTSSTIIALAADYSLALSENMSQQVCVIVVVFCCQSMTIHLSIFHQMWVIDSNSQLELVVLESPIRAICWLSVGMLLLIVLFCHYPPIELLTSIF